MTDLLRTAVERIAQLPDDEQDQYARLMQQRIAEWKAEDERLSGATRSDEPSGDGSPSILES